MTTTTKTAKKLYEVFANNHDDDVIQDYKTKLNICTDENRISVWMTVNRKTLKSAYSYFHKALEQAVADGALDAKIAQFGEFADDADCIDFGGKDSITAFDNIDSSFAYGIDDNTCCDLGYYFWFWVKTNETAAEDNVEVIAETDGSEEDDAESFTANVMSAEYDDTDDELIDPAEKITAQVEDEPALVDCAYEFNLENGVREFKIGDAETGDVISFQGSRLFKITSTKHDARLYRDEDGTLHFDIKCYDGSPQLTMHDVTPDEFFAYVEVHDTTREEIARLPLVELKRKHARVFEESLRLGEYLFCSEDRTAYDKAHARLMQLICNGCADTAERWRLEEVNAPRRKRIVDAEIKYSCLQYKIGKYAEEIDAREKAAVRAQEPRESVSNVEDNILLDPAKIVSETPEASTKIKKLFSRRKNHERKKPHVTFNTGRVEWYTPPAVIKAVRAVLGEIDLDPASTAEANQIVGAKNFFTKDDDGLKHDWLGKIFCNPPYSRGLIDKFVAKLLREFADGRTTEAIVLTNAATDTDWAHKLMALADQIIFTKKRLKFLKPDGSIAGTPTCGQMFCYFGERSEKFYSAFAQFGLPITFSLQKKYSRQTPTTAQIA